MRKLLASTIFVAGLLGFSAGAHASECGTVTVANMNWQSAELLAQIDKVILSDGYGCDIELVAGDTMPTLTSMMEKGQPDVAPEAWINVVREPLDKAVAEGRLIYAGKSLTDGGVEGWWIPDFVAQANPQIKTIDDALAHPELFPSPEDKTKGGVHNCPSGWNCQITTANFFNAHEAEKKGFVLVDTGSAAGLDGSIAKAFERKKGWLGYYWAPTAILGKYKMVRLGFNAEFDQDEWNNCTSVLDCPSPKKNAWPSSDVLTVVTSSFAERSGPAIEYLKKRGWPNNTVNELLSWMSDNQATGEEGADHFLKNYPQVWTEWVTPEVAEKIKKATM